MSLISIPFTYSAGAVIIASQHNSCNSVIYNDYNGYIDNTNLATNAAIAYSKLSLTGAILNADLAGLIADSKLLQITTASKVSGAAITLLTSLPSGAGVIPIANVATGTPTGAKFVRDDSTLQVITDTNTSNVLFQYSAVTSLSVTLGTGIGEVIGSNINPTTGGTYRFLQTKQPQSTYGQVWQTQWKKIAGVSTITVYVEVWNDGSGGDGTNVKVAVGAASGNVTGTLNQNSPEWKNFTIDVSGLSNGTVYTVNASLQHTENNTTRSLYLGNLIAFGS